MHSINSLRIVELMKKLDQFANRRLCTLAVIQHKQNHKLDPKVVRIVFYWIKHFVKSMFNLFKKRED